MRPLLLILVTLAFLSGVAFPHDIYLPESYMDEQSFEIELVSDNGETLGAYLTRRKSVESIPFWAEYDVTFEVPVQAHIIRDDPGLLEIEGEPLVSTLIIDDFRDADEESELSTSWSFHSAGNDRPTPEICRNTNGYFLAINAGGTASVSLGSVPTANVSGVYILASGGGPYMDFEVALNGRGNMDLAYGLSEVPALYLFPLDRFENGRPEKLDNMQISISTEHNVFTGMQVYEVGLYGALDDCLDAPGIQVRSTFVFSSNSVSRSICVVADDGDGQIYVFKEELDFPLHHNTRILLDSSLSHSSEAPDEAVRWMIGNGDPEDMSFRMESGLGQESSYLECDWPNVLRVSSASGNGESRDYYALIYWRDGCPIKHRGFSPINLEKADPLAIERSWLLAKDLGFNAVKLKVFWHYGWPDSDGNFTLQQYPCSQGDCPPEGGSLSDEDFVDLAKSAESRGFDVWLLLRQTYEADDPGLEQRYHSYGGYQGECFMCTNGFLFGNGQGYWSQLEHFARLVPDLPVDMVLLGAESDFLLVHGGEKVRTFYQDAMEMFRAQGYDGAFSYAFCDTGYCDQYGVELQPDVGGVPYADMDFVAINEYSSLALDNEASTESMYWEALGIVTDYFADLRDLYGRPIFVSDLVINAYDGVATDAPGDQSDIQIKARDDEEQRRYMTAWLRALSGVAIDDESLFGVCIGDLPGTADRPWLSCGSCRIHEVAVLQRQSRSPRYVSCLSEGCSVGKGVLGSLGLFFPSPRRLGLRIECNE